MLVMSEVTDPCRVDTMTKGEGKGEVIDLKGVLARDADFVRAAVEVLVQAAMTETIGAEKGERGETRLSSRSGYYGRSLITRVGTLELPVPQDRMGRFSTELFEGYQRSEKALVGSLAEMYVHGVSTRKSLPLRKQGSRRSRKSCAATASRLRQSVRSTSGWMRVWRNLPAGRWPKPSPI